MSVREPVIPTEQPTLANRAVVLGLKQRRKPAEKRAVELRSRSCRKKNDDKVGKCTSTGGIKVYKACQGSILTAVI